MPTRTKRLTRRHTCKLELPMGDFEEWNIPAEYALALREHIHSTPTLLRRQWPIQFMPTEGDAVDFPAIPISDSEWIAGKKEFSFDDDSITVWIRLTHKCEAPQEFDLRTLLAFSMQGFEMEDGTSIKSILRKAKLSLTDD